MGRLNRKYYFEAHYEENHIITIINYPVNQCVNVTCLTPDICHELNTFDF